MDERRWSSFSSSAMRFCAADKRCSWSLVVAGWRCWWRFALAVCGELCSLLVSACGGEDGAAALSLVRGRRGGGGGGDVDVAACAAAFASEAREREEEEGRDASLETSSTAASCSLASCNGSGVGVVAASGYGGADWTAAASVRAGREEAARALAHREGAPCATAAARKSCCLHE